MLGTGVGVGVGVGEGAEVTLTGVGVGAAADEELTLPQPTIISMTADEVMAIDIFKRLTTWSFSMIPGVA